MRIEFANFKKRNSKLSFCIRKNSWILPKIWNTQYFTYTLKIFRFRICILWFLGNFYENSPFRAFFMKSIQWQLLRLHHYFLRLFKGIAQHSYRFILLRDIITKAFEIFNSIQLKFDGANCEWKLIVDKFISICFDFSEILIKSFRSTTLNDICLKAFI